ncbi:amidohydrolase family protein [Albimonas pacifica]|uniref:2-pyrone-4,6-dicarboxylate hydrolase n=1 Tax=Albimonas pacifica TaxID=1114924 RepID=A0A1I3FTE2_9RHOB|nr:amidohydrolase family protein [Albimonas pacifica]SFI14506.1 2-pyrone-4,6-dicarboxylate hydrolase [Albimonas pacifica]
MSEDHLEFHPAPKVPEFRPPVGAVDAHCHIFGPAAKFPFAPERKYTPVDAPKERLFALRDHLGFARNVIVQATCHGKDNAAMVDALLDAGPGRARGVAIVDMDVADAELEALHAAGVRGVRFNFLKRLVGNAPLERYARTAERIEALGWHVVVYFEAHELADLEPFLSKIPGVLVVDHMGRPDVAEGVGGPSFARVLAFMEGRPDAWIKVSCPERLTVAGPPYDDVVPFGRTLVERFPDRVLWGTDWPHPNMRSHMPDDGALVDVIPRIAPTAELQRKLLVDNPMRLYWPGETAEGGR